MSITLSWMIYVIVIDVPTELNRNRPYVYDGRA